MYFTLKNNLIALAALGFALHCVAISEATVIAYWRFEPGSFLVDSSGNGHTLTGNATQSLTVANVAGGLGSASFNGTTQGLHTVTNLDLSSYSNLRVSFAIRNSGTISGFGTVVEHTPNKNSNPGAIFVDVDELSPGVGAAALQFLSPPATGNSNQDQLPSFNNGVNWDLYQIDFTPLATAANVVTVTRNGVLLADTTAFDHATTTSHAFLNNIFYLGARGGTSSFFNGLIDEVLIEAPPFTGPPVFSVPEPGTGTLLGMGALGLLYRSRRRRASITQP